MNCDHCNTTVVDDRCEGCELYNAAIAAEHAAAESITKSRAPASCNPWINEYGVFAWLDGVTVQLGTPEEAAPFVGIASEAREVVVHWRGEPVATTKKKRAKRLGGAAR